MKLPLHLLRNSQNWPVGTMLLLLLCPAPVRAATLTVTSAADSGSGSLRAIIAGANAGDYINFSSPLAGQTIHLTSGELSIGKNLTIDASSFGSAVVIDAGGLSRVLEITAGNVTLAGLTLTNGASPAGTGGGGIQVDANASLYLNSVTISHCTANNGSVGGGIDTYPSTSLTVLFSTISGCTATNGNSSGGGIFSSGTTLLQYCTLTGNRSDYGGGIYGNFSGVLTLNNCTLSGNFALNGGGIYNYGGTTTIKLNNCTLSANSAAGLSGGFYNPGGNQGTVVFTNTIIAGNTASAFMDMDGTNAGANNFIGGDPKLAPLGNYGGPTQTMQPLSGSPVIDAGTDSVTNFMTYDQRISLRLSGAHVDIGAVEKQFSAPASQPLVLSNARRPSNQFQFAFTNAPNVDFTALSSTNLALPLTNWTALGNVTEISSGQYQFTDSATNHAQFYRVVSP